MQNIFIDFLPPWVETGLQPAFYDKESGTVLQQVARMYAKVNQLVKAFDDLDEATVSTVNEYIQKFTELHDYVQDYFDNLDVQEEINNKLDEMVESGQMSDLIAQYIGLGALVTFDTLTDLIASENLNQGSKCITLGKNTLNDGYGAYYTIDETGDIELDNGLYATLVPNFGGNNYYDDIIISTGRVHETDYTIATIPVNDSDGNIINPYVAEYQNDTPLTYAQKNFTTVTTNAGLTRQDSNGVWRQGAVISNGVALHGDLCDVEPHSYMRYIGFKEDRTIVDFPAIGTTTDVMLAQGVKNAYLVFNKSINNGVIDIPEALQDDTDTSPRMDLGVKLDGTIIILASEGRKVNNVGLTMQESAELLLSLGCVNAWRCDGGGSTSLVYKGSKQNRNIDDNATLDRDIHVTLNFKKTTIDKQLAEVYSYVGRQKQLLNKQIRDDLHAEFRPSYLYAGEPNTVSGLNVMASNDVYQTILSTGQNRVGHYITANRLEGSNRIESYQLNQKGIYKFSFIGQITGGTSLPHNFIIRAKRVSDNYVIATNVINKTTDGGFNIVLEFAYNNTSDDGEAILFEAQGSQGMQVLRNYINVEYMGASV